ncbi:MAG: methyl-accepting chemotaxis protein [Bacillota bacterium]|nr:methyl-accepting chemotaxis protein [Bacillota bacterium]
MHWFNNLKIKTKLLLCFILVAIFTAVVGTVGIANMYSISSKGQSMYDNNLISIRNLSDVQRNLLVSHLSYLQVTSTGDTLSINKIIAEYETNKNENNGLLKEYEKTVMTEEEKKEYADFTSKLKLYRGLKDQIGELLRQEKLDEVKTMLSNFNDAESSCNDSLTKLIDINKNSAKTLEDSNNNTFRITSISMLIIILIAVGLAVFIGIKISTYLSSRIKKLSEATENLAVGNLEVELDENAKDEIGDLSRSFEVMIKNSKEQAFIAEGIAEGDLNVKVTVRSEQDLLGGKLNEMVMTIKALVNEINALTVASQHGKLDVRGNSEVFKGTWAEMMQGINSTMDVIIEPINEATQVIKGMADGNLDLKVTGDYKGQHAEIKHALNASIESFNQILGDINTSAEQLASGSAQVSSSSQDLSQGATEQASAVEQITSSMTEIGAQTKENAASANHASELAEATKLDADNGKHQMLEMLSAMNEINESSANISKIIKVIDEIAFQTNILALNAAVEAARAGQHGKGFAVVAEEVRNLAARSANAAKETTAMIEESIKKSEQGKAIAQDTAEALNKIVDNINQVNNIIAEIAIASNEQAQGIAQINEAVEQVSKVTQMNTATSEETASASEELSSQAVLLKQMVGRFRLKSNAGMNNYNDEVIMFDSVMKGRRRKPHLVKHTQDEDAIGDHNIKITLDDDEFGKYTN